MAIKALTLSSVKLIESESDPAKGTADATRFTIGAIDAFVSAYVFDRTLTFTETDAGGIATAQVKMSEANLEAVRFGLRGWENFKDQSGNDVPFTTSDRIVMGKKYVAVADDCLALLNQDLVRELAAAIRRINEVGPDDAKKSVAA
ncbi:MAG: hypothetical protein U1E60_00395 [Reyranellaceae bacterium]